MATRGSHAGDVLSAFDFADEVDSSTFEQILDMDEDEEGGHEFSKSIVFGLFDSCESTFDKMDEVMDKKENPSYEMGPLAKFIGGQAKTTGFSLMAESCDKIENYSKLKDATGKSDIDMAQAWKLIGEELGELKYAYHRVKAMMQKFYAQLDG